MNLISHPALPPIIGVTDAFTRGFRFGPAGARRRPPRSRRGAGRIGSLCRRVMVACAFWGLLLATADAAGAMRDVLFIGVGDLNDWIQLLDPAAPIATPNLQRLARRGVSFTRAYAASPACNPSRTALLTGRATASTGVYGNRSDWRGTLPAVVTLPQAFMHAGYRVEGAGKIFHHHFDGAFHDTASFHDFRPLPSPPDAPMPGTKLNRLPAFGSANTDWGAWPENETEAPDVRAVDWCIERLGRSRTAPLFLACGLFRRHMSAPNCFPRFPDPASTPMSSLFRILPSITRTSGAVGWWLAARTQILTDMKAVFLAWLALAASVITLGAESARPNVLFIAVDDLRTNLGCFGDPVAQTPHLDALAERGVRFTRAYCQQAVCNPSRASVITGRRPDTLRVWDLRTHFREHLPEVVTLPQHFKHHGYHTEAIGKILHDPPKFRDPPSWSVPAQLDDTEGVRGKYARADNLLIYEPVGKKGREKAAAAEAAVVADNAYIDGRVAELAVTRLRELAAQAQPFFLAVGFRRPHLPFSAPQRYWDLYDPEKLKRVPQPGPPRGAPAVALHGSTELRGYTDMPKAGSFTPAQITTLRHGYYAATSFVDAQIGRVLSALRGSGAERNTLVVLWSDHGFHLGEHGLWGKTTNYEIDTRVPLIIARPGMTRAGAVSTALTELLDLFPTLADLCGLPAPEGIEGRTLRPWLDDPAHPSRPAAFSQFPRPWTYGHHPEVMGYAVRTATHRYVEWRRFGTRGIIARELYTLDGQQLVESENLADRPAESPRLQQLSALLSP